jgi:chemotaxis protein MotB
MSARRSGRRRGEEEAHNDERWLLTYADMITLLMALFMVLFSISSVNISKFKDLQRSLQDAFSGRVLPGGRSIKEAGGSDQVETAGQSLPNPALQQRQGGLASAAAREQDDFQKLKAQIDAYARAHGLSTKISTRVDRRGLHVRVLTDRLFFDSGSADIQPDGLTVVSKLSQLFAAERAHPVQVEGHTDPQPIHSDRFPTNWELSAEQVATPSNPTPGSFPEPHFGP